MTVVGSSLALGHWLVIRAWALVLRAPHDFPRRMRYNSPAMTPAAQVACLIPVAYVLGSVPFGLIVGLAKGKDPRLHGSGNIGATNVARVLGGKRWFFLVFVLDLLKSLVPMLVAGRLLRGVEPHAGEYATWIAVGLAAILGHVFSLFLKFRGGKGVATSAGVVLGIWPYLTVPGLIAIGVFAVVFLISRYVSLGSIVAAASLPVLYVAVGLTRTPRWPVLDDQLPLLVAAVLVAVMIVAKHKANIARLMAGTENKFTTRR